MDIDRSSDMFIPNSEANLLFSVYRVEKSKKILDSLVMSIIVRSKYDDSFWPNWTHLIFISDPVLFSKYSVVSNMGPVGLH